MVATRHHRARPRHADAARYEVLEQSARIGGDEILTLVLIRDEGILENWGHKAQFKRATLDVLVAEAIASVLLSGAGV